MLAITTIGLDIAQYVFQVHRVDAQGSVVVRRQLKRRYVLAFFKKLPPCKDEKIRLSLTNDGGNELLLFNPLDLAVSKEDGTDEEVVDELYNDFSKLIVDQR